jgi:hypothetical protein
MALLGSLILNLFFSKRKNCRNPDLGLSEEETSFLNESL